MTTILITRDSIFADSQVSTGNDLNPSIKNLKLIPLPNGEFGISVGVVVNTLELLHHYLNPKDKNLKTPKGSVHILKPSGEIKIYRPQSCGHNPPEQFWSGVHECTALGSGGAFAKNYMKYVNNDPVEAMMHAGDNDAGTNKDIVEIPRRRVYECFDDPTWIKHYPGVTAKGKPRKPVTLEVDHPLRGNAIMEIFTGLRPALTLDQLTKVKGKK
jgi:hypothetical protein